MISKTPQFDRALDAILKDLKPHDRQCKECNGAFHIFQEDIEFYQMLRVPPPVHPWHSSCMPYEHSSSRML